MNGKPRQLPSLGQKSSLKGKRASNNAQENKSQNKILIKHEKRNKIISSAFGKKKRESIEHEERFKANLPGITLLLFN